MTAHIHHARQWLAARMPRGAFWTFFSVSVFFNFGFSIFFFYFNIYLLGFGLNERSLGLIASLAFVGTILGTIPIGICAERFGLRATLTAGILCAVLFSVLRVLFVWQSAQLVLAVLVSLSMSVWAVCLSPAVAGLTNEAQRPFAFSLMFSSGIGIVGLGNLASGRLPAWLKHHAHAPLTNIEAGRLTLLIACSIVALALIPACRLALRTPVAPRTRLVRLSNPFLQRFLPAMAVWGLVTGAFPPFANVFFVRHLNLSLERTGAIFSLSHVVQFLAVLSAPLIFRRTGLTTGIMGTQLATAAALALLAGSSPSHAAWFYWAYMGAQCMNEPGIYSLLMDRTPAADRSAASSYTFFVSAIAQAIASATVGIAIVRVGYSSVLTVLSILAVAAAVLFRRLPQTDSPATPEAAETTVESGLAAIL